jgi:hypothetical protein
MLSFTGNGKKIPYIPIDYGNNDILLSSLQSPVSQLIPGINVSPKSTQLLIQYLQRLVLFSEFYTCKLLQVANKR